ncbi:toll/interleukin-1 receptor domain-containing protein [Bacillus thuringiensis]|uniref:toll/interleukin-1 receptor domain-containing protein n=1 Tax=Bacillus thuringiensis TaxID=1428 RepID=UPI0020BFC4D9|nr:toll/interleukin-1 receptor domain-containing protein [Bacillus thuringiensis]
MEQNKEFGSRPPKVFISYSWTSPDYKEKVISLANRLTENGIEVVIDVWDLKPGHNMFAFMESMVTDSTIDKVLVLCNKSYAERASSYNGGVGTETQIIGPEVYTKVKQEKFIPVILERDENEKDYIPVHMKGLIYIDLHMNFEEGYESLLRLLYEQPLLRKPKLGSPPAYLFDEKKTKFKVSGVLSSIRDAIVRHPNRVKGLCRDYKQAFIQDLEAFKLTYEELKEPFDEKITNLIHEMVPLRDNYIQFIEQLCVDESLFDPKIITNFFESIYPFSNLPVGYSGSFYTIQFDHYKYLIHELFLYTAAVLISRQMYTRLTEILHHRYFVQGSHLGELKDGGYELFYFYLESLEARNNRLSLSRVSVHGDLIRNSCSSTEYSWESLIEADFLLYCIHNIQILQNKNNAPRFGWYPITSAFTRFSNPSIPLLHRLKSKTHFDDIKGLLSIDSIEHLQQIIELSATKGRESGVPAFAHLVPQEIGIY